MTDADRKPFLARLTGVYALHGKPLSPAVISIWCETMRPFDFAAVADAMNRHAVNPDNGQYLPKPADIVKLIGGNTLDAALLAWSKVEGAVSSVGAYESVCFDDPIINQALLDMGGWVAICHKNVDELPFAAKEFENRYRGYRTRAKLDQWPRQLGGISSSANGQNWFATAPPVLIGDVEQAKRVYLGGKVAQPQLTRAPALLEKPETVE